MSKHSKSIALRATKEFWDAIEKEIQEMNDPMLTPRGRLQQIMYGHFDLEPPGPTERRRAAPRKGFLHAIGVSMTMDQRRVVSFAAASKKMSLPAYGLSQIEKEARIFSESLEPLRPFGQRTESTPNPPSYHYQKPVDRDPMAFGFIIRVDKRLHAWIERRSEERGDIPLAAVAREIIVGGATHDQDEAMRKVGA